MFWELSQQIGLRAHTAATGRASTTCGIGSQWKLSLRWYRSGCNVDRRMYVLSTYLGTLSRPAPTGI